MCLAIPMQIIAIDGQMARCDARGIQRDISLFMLEQAPVVGDFVLVHVGYAIQVLAPEAARENWQLIDEMEARESGA